MYNIQRMKNINSLTIQTPDKIKLTSLAKGTSRSYDIITKYTEYNNLMENQQNSFDRRDGSNVTFIVELILLKSDLLKH